MSFQTKYNHFTDEELVRHADREPLSEDLKTELVTRVRRLLVKLEARETGYCRKADRCEQVD